ncbi:alkene reductase [Sinisalibacter aestuarii]|uniref:Alkene reductase n=1 Tax=Sinisalibacter aestuarii TaxID=2949426 RepID=A0ABQ5LY57_9RHOB|nr:alkene reductase [Sinisalibacter aestuarii]GKY89895.1 alkene reductase [Sinisalibacter aestuarii]
MSKLFDGYNLAGLQLQNRVVMAPMTRSRAIDNNPNEDTALYYSQRASAGLIITEGAPISPEARGYLYTPGIHSAEQVAGWRRVTDAVHEAGGRIFIQLWHVGRVSHTSLQPNGGDPVTSSTAPCETTTCFAYTDDGGTGHVPVSPARALTKPAIARVVGDYVDAAKLSVDAGFDGVEIHGANGYLIEQFVNASVNNRQDEYGGSIENRLRFVFEVIDAISAAIGAQRVGIRVAPFGRLFDMQPFPDERETWIAFAKEANNRDIAYVHLSDQLTDGSHSLPEDFRREFRNTFKGTLMAAGGFTAETASAAVETGELDLVAFGKPFISNPDLVERMKNRWELTEPDRQTFYTQTHEGYIDYPTFGESHQAMPARVSS